MEHAGRLVRFFGGLLMLGLLADAGAWAAPAADASGGETRTGSILWKSLKRTYRLHVPPPREGGGPMPLVIALHGGGGSGRRMEALTRGGLNRLADREGFVVVYPDGVERHWNDGRKKVRYRAHRDGIDDVGFLTALMDRLFRELPIDAKRVYVAGMSNGAVMAYRLACELSGRIAAIAAVAGAMPAALAAHCAPASPVSVLAISNREDPMVPWEGGELRFGPLRLGTVLSALDTVRFWAARNRCPPPTGIAWKPDQDPHDGTRVWWQAYGPCEEGTEVVLYGIEGGGHTWPGGYPYLPEWFIGRTSREMDTNRVLWDFFRRHAKKEKRSRS